MHAAGRDPVLRAVLISCFCLLGSIGMDGMARADTTKPFSPMEPVVASLHVHSTASTGDLSMEALLSRARSQGLDVVMLSENYVLDYEYGLWPLRGVLKWSVDYPSVLEYGLDRFLAEAAEIDAKHPDVLLIPGVEVVPHYSWTGSLLTRDLTMHNAQKNLLVLGLDSPRAYEALPVLGNTASYEFGSGTLERLAPILLLVPAWWLWCRPKTRRLHVGVVPYRMTRRRRLVPALLTGAAVLLLVHASPFRQPVYSAYEDEVGYEPFQTFIDRVQEQGGMAFWSMPEARDFHEFDMGPLGKVTVKTDPYPEALKHTHGYTGFGGLYQDTRTATEPGHVWDQVLLEYLEGKRDSPPFIVGEIAFHGLDQTGKDLDQVLTVLWAQERTRQGVLEALKAGRMYAVDQYRKGDGLRLETFVVSCADGTLWAMSGETLSPGRGCDPVVRVDVSSTDRQNHPVTIRLVRNGEILDEVGSSTSAEYRYRDRTAPEGKALYYRIAVQGGGGEILSNPIFVERHPRADMS